MLLLRVVVEISLSGSTQCAAGTQHWDGLLPSGQPRATVLVERFHGATCSLHIGEAASTGLLSGNWATPRVL